MKKLVCRILRTVLYPLFYCYQIVMDAPVLCCDNELFGFSEAAHTLPDEGTSCGSAHRPAAIGETGWVCRAR